MLLSVALLGHASGIRKPGISWLLDSLNWIAWAVSPYAAVFLLALKRANRAASLISCILTIIVVGFGALVYIDGFFIHPDAQSALLFLFVPLYQWGMVVLGGLLLLISIVRQRR